MRRLSSWVTALVVVMSGMVGLAPPAAASTTWTLPSGSFSVQDTLGSTTADIAVQNLRITDGTSALGYVRVTSSAGRYPCTTSNFSGLDAILVPSSTEACVGSVSFNVSADGQVSATASFTIGSYQFGGSATLGGATRYPPLITCSVTADGSTGAQVTFSDPGQGASSYSVSSTPPLPAGSTQSTSGTTIAVTGLSPATTYTFTVSQSGGTADPGTCTGSVTTPARPDPPQGTVSYGAITGTSNADAEREYTLGTTVPTPSGWDIAWLTPSGMVVTPHGSQTCNTTSTLTPQWTQSGSSPIAGAAVSVSPPCSVPTPSLIPAPVSHLDGSTVTVNYTFPGAVAAEPGTVVWARFTIVGETRERVAQLGSPPANGPAGAGSFDVPGLKPGTDVRVQLYATNGPITSANDAWATIPAKPAKPAFTLAYAQSAVYAAVGSAMTDDAPTVTPAQTGLTYAITAGVLPAGITLSPSSGVISGVAAAPVTASTVTVTATQSPSGARASTDVTFSISPATSAGVTGLAYPNVPSTPADVPMSVQPSGATPGQSFALDAASIAAGMVIDAATGRITWTPTPAQRGVATVTVTVTANGAATALAPFTITVVAAPATNRPAPTATMGSASAAGASTGGTGGSSGSGGSGQPQDPCLAPNGTLYSDIHGSAGSTLTMAPNTFGLAAPVSFTVTGGSLPRGVWLDGTYGVISGTPERSNGGHGPVEITTTWADGMVRVSDIMIAVDDPHHAVNYPNRIIGAVGAATAVTPFLVNAVGVKRYELVCGSLPTGTTMDPRTGVISGTPTAIDERPVPLRVRMTDSYGWVDSSFLFVVDSGVTPWLRYPELAEIGTGRTVRIVPTRSGLAPTDSYRLTGTLPPGLRLNRTTGVISGSATVRDGFVYEPTITAIGADGAVQASAVPSMVVVKPAVPITVTARGAARTLRQGATVVVAKVRHPRYSSLSATVSCTACAWSFDKRTGRLVVKPGARTAKVTVSILAAPRGAKARATYAGHVWSRTWRVR